MKILLSYKQQVIISMLLLLLSFSGMFFVEATGSYPSYSWSSLIIALSGLYLVLSCSIFSVQSILFVIIFFPAFTPFYSWDIRDGVVFSLAAQQLQSNIELVNKTVFLFAIASISYTAAASLRIPKSQIDTKASPMSLDKLPDWVLVVLSFLVIVTCYVLEPGPTLLTADYSTVLEGRFGSSPLVILASTIFGGLWALLFLFGRHRKKIFWAVTLFVMVWLLLRSRRVELMGIFLCLFLWGRNTAAKGVLSIFTVVFLSIMVAIGYVRDNAILDRVQLSSNNLNIKKEALPGGMSNVFLSGLHLVNQKDSGELTNEQQFTIVEWFRAMIPNYIWQSFGFSKVKTEHDLIFKEFNLQYVGGMPLLGAFYLNGGALFVLLFGIIHGFLARVVEQIVAENYFYNLRHNSRWKIYLATVFLLYQFRYQWYMPQTLFRIISFTCFALLIVNFLSRVSGWKRSIY